MSRAAPLLVLLATVFTLLGISPMPAGRAAAEEPLPPKLDVAAALRAFETQQIYRAPGAVAYFDTELIRRELTPDIRVLIAPFTGPMGEGGNYASHDEHFDQVYDQLMRWSERTGNKWVRVEGLHVSSSEGVAASPSDLAELRRVTARYDVTDLLWLVIRHAKGVQTASGSPNRPAAPVVPATPRQLTELERQLREEPVYNAPGRDDPVELSVERIRERTGLRVRVAALPVADPNGPMAHYARPLARRFPGEVVLVAHGGWLEVAGAHHDELVSARDYAYGRYEGGSFEQGITMTDRIGTVLLRADQLLTEHPFGRPPPRTSRQLIGALAPWLVGGSAVVIGGTALLRTLLRRARRARADREALREAGAEAFAEIAELGRRLLDGDGGRDAAAAERHATATTLFEQAHTPAAMAEVRDIAAQGQRLLREERGS
ncbi:hypothetical protein SacmaDRAFT_0873 [Saccharomonospora marina XMU15]|uniref:Uncharacterized protein n=1 Tax=Saccharomonospora marina XMU15 TaxID=882083 RepID=H5X964_9PSEU|nr:hypothetical protein [Saccharomonospora marina]EHR49166.1 hypothetical protein SacmaDRAFT_0873 [Saccharomonospora marina XMU15]